MRPISQITFQPRIYSSMYSPKSWRIYFGTALNDVYTAIKLTVKFAGSDVRSISLAQLSGRSSLQNFEVCLRAHGEKLYHLGLPSGISKNTLAKANEKHGWHIYTDFAYRLIDSTR